MFLVVLALISACCFRSKKNFFLFVLFLSGYTLLISKFSGYHFSQVFFMSMFGNEFIWGETVTYEPAEILSPKDVVSLSKIIASCEKCRVVGSRHSFSPLIVTNETQIDLKYLTGLVSDDHEEVTFWAGSTVEEVLIYLTQTNRTLHGIGSIHSQTLGGALSTSLVGVFTTSFSSHVTKVVTLNAKGEEVEWNDPYFIRNSMGMLGVVIKVSMRTFPNKATRHKHEKMNIDDIISFWNQTEFISSDSSFTVHDIRENKKVDVVHNYITNDTFETQYPHYWDVNQYLMYELFTGPFSWFFNAVLDDVKFWAINPLDRETAMLGIDREQYGFTYTDYIVPLKNCSNALKEVAKIDGVNPLIRMKYMKEPNASCFDPTQVPSCRLELYESHAKDNIYSTIQSVQDIMLSHGGFVHWGKLYLGNITDQLKRYKCYNTFENIRKVQDPTGKFLNDYLEGKKTDYNEYGARKWVTLSYVLCFVVSALYLKLKLLF